MTFPDIVTRDQWLAARKRLLVLEKQATRDRDAVSLERRRLPMVAVEKDYLLDGPDGQAPLAALFGGSRQLIIRHIMFGPDWDAACPGCTAAVDEVSGALLAHLRSRDTAFALVSRAPLDKLAAYQAQQGWTLPWYSSYRSDFNVDFQATVDSGRQQLMYNYREEPGLLEGQDSTEVPGLSCFLRQEGQVFHTYSTWARGTDVLVGAYTLLDLTALGRQEDWEEPAGRAPRLHAADPAFTS